MKGITTVLVLALLVVPCLAFASNGPTLGRTEQPVVREQVDYIVAPDIAGPPQVWNRNTELLAPIPPGIYPVGVGAPQYITLDSAISDLQINGVAGGGTVYFQLLDPSYVMTTGKQIGGYPGQGPAAPVVFKPAPGVVTTIKAAGATYVFRLFNASGVTFDGSNIWPSSGTDRSMTVDADTTLGNRNVFLLENGCSFITLENLVLPGSRRSTGNGSEVIRLNNVTFAAPQNNILISNVWAYRGLHGVYVRGASTAIQDQNITIVGNLIGGAGLTDDLSKLFQIGVYLEAVNNAVVAHNDISGIRGLASMFGLRLQGGWTNVQFLRNKVHDLITTGGNNRPMYIIAGALVTGGGPALRNTALIANNFFYDAHNLSTTATRGAEGIFFNPTATPSAAPGGGVTVRLINNTFAWNLAAGEGAGTNIFVYDGNFFGSGTSGTEPDTMLMYNNVSSTRRVDGFTRTFLLFANGVIPGQFNWFSNNNVFDQRDGGSFGQYPVPWPDSGTTVRPTFLDWQTITGNDLNSRQGDPVFVSYLDPHVSTAVGDVSAADSVAIPWPGITDDIDGQPRNATKPDAGADEFTLTRYVNDILPISIDAPVSPIGAGGPFTPLATFKNVGTTSYALADVRFEILNNLGSVVYTSNKQIALPGYDNTAQATFDALPAGLVAGSYTMRAVAVLVGDQKLANDTLAAALNSLLVIPLATGDQYWESFEDAAPGPELFGGLGWVTDGVASDWVIGTPAKTQLSGAASGSKCLVTKITGNYTPDQESYAYTPVFDLTTFTGPLYLEFYQNFKIESEWDFAILQYSTDGGATWRRVDSTLGTGTNFDTPTSTAWYNEGTDQGGNAPPYWSGNNDGFGVSSAGYSSEYKGWIRSRTSLVGVAGLADVRFRFRFFSDGAIEDEGWAIDEVRIGTLVDVTFQADMRLIMRAGDFRPDLGDVVQVRGNVSTWGANAPVMSDGDADSIYTATIGLDEASSYQYKFWKSPRGGYEWEDAIGNRTFTLGANDTTLGPFLFNNWNEFRYVTFQVDMSVQQLEGKFLPDSDFVFIPGKFNNWSTNADQAADGDADTVYTLQMPVVFATGDVQEYKFYKSPRAGSDWESVANRSFPGPTADTVLAVVFFNDDAVVDQANFVVDPTSLAFGEIAIGDSAVQTLKVYNPGSQLTLDITSIVSDHPDFTVDPALGTVAVDDSLTVSVKFKPTAPGPKVANITFTHNAPSSPDAVQATGSGPGFLMLTLTPIQVFDENPLKPGKSNKAVKRAKPGKPVDPVKNVPNWSNVLSEVVAQGGFAPGTSESDSAGGMVVGTSFMYYAGKWKVDKESSKVYCWMRMSKWNFAKNVGKSHTDFQKTLLDKVVGFHDGTPSGFDFTTDGKNKPLLKQLKKLTPKKQDNALIPELIALKVNIAASQLGTLPVGFGDLVYDNDGNTFDEQSILAISATADQMMTYWAQYDSADFQELYDVVYAINRALDGPLDTLQFNAYDLAENPLPLLVKGQVDVYTVPFLKVPTPFVATTTPRLNNEVDGGEDFEDEEWEDGEGVPVAAKLYQNYPNPFNPSTTIAFQLREESMVSVRIFNVLGQQVATLLNGETLDEGLTTLEFNAANLSSGIYFYQIDVQGLGDEGMKTLETRKMLLVK